MATEIYGASDDIVEVAGDVTGETSPGDDATGVLLFCDDGTILHVKYGKPGLGGVWGVQPIKTGHLFDRIELCQDEDAERYSDTAYFKDGLKTVWAAKEWEQVS